MENRDLDRRCAEILGWTQVQQSVPFGFWVGKALTDPNGPFVDIPEFSTDLNASRELIDWASKQMSDKFANAIFDKFERIPNNYGAAIMQALRLTPRQICEAFVETFGVPATVNSAS